MAQSIPRDTTGLSLPYRLGWRIKYLVLTVMGPADLDGMKDPRYRMRSQRWNKVNQARAERGLQPLDPTDSGR